MRDTDSLVLVQSNLLSRSLQVLVAALVGTAARTHDHLGHLLQPLRRLRLAKVRARQQAGGDDLRNGSVSGLTLTPCVLAGGLLQRPNILQRFVALVRLWRLLR